MSELHVNVTPLLICRVRAFAPKVLLFDADTLTSAPLGGVVLPLDRYRNLAPAQVDWYNPFVTRRTQTEINKTRVLPAS
jgi:hypothetical protein